LVLSKKKSFNLIGKNNKIAKSLFDSKPSIYVWVSMFILYSLYLRKKYTDIAQNKLMLQCSTAVSMNSLLHNLLTIDWSKWQNLTSFDPLLKEFWCSLCTTQLKGLTFTAIVHRDIWFKPKKFTFVLSLGDIADTILVP